MRKSEKDISYAAEILKNGGLVSIPTETVYGLAASAFNPDAIARIFEVKNRPYFDPLIVHAGSMDEVLNFTEEIPDMAMKLAEAFWPGPLTLLLRKKDSIPSLVTSGMQRVAVRVPNHQMTLKLLAQLDFPLVAPSANPFGYVSPTTAAHVEKQLGSKIDYILDGGECQVGIESTIIGFDGDETVIYRLGGLEKEQIEKVTGEVIVRPKSTSNPLAPGMLNSHYAPSKKIVIGDLDNLPENLKGMKIGILRFQGKAVYDGSTTEIILSEEGDLREAAKNLFSALRLMDDTEIDIIIAEMAPNHGLGLAINDRLKRAAMTNS